MSKESVAMLLAGGQGSRLYALTQTMAKPAVPFGGKYRIIDFPLSNCINSGIDTVGVLTQYQPLELNEYIGDGRPWDLDRIYGGVHVLPPYQKSEGSDWYRGTANAIYQNINFIEKYDPKYVLILSGDHIYKMNYSKMIAAHRQTGADCTIAVIQVPKEEASRFGIMNVREDGSVYEFEEKPKNPKSDLASMGIYVFSWDKLRRYLELDEKKEDSSNDFGKDVIPAMLDAGERLFTYSFEGYWRDVGTIDSLWESNMDLIDPKVPFDLWDPSFKVYSRNAVKPPHYLGHSGVVQNSVITEGCYIDGLVDFSVLSPGVVVEHGAVVRDSIIMPNCVIESGAVVQYSIIAENVRVQSGAVIGERPENIEDKDSWGISVIASDLVIGKNSKIGPKVKVYIDVKEGEDVC